ncbi:helix-turn-helix domain-containing protein [Paracraurococcus lichenis]|uniref:AraC family transcriptional regulator n=1 Tax=Paracraurococcus lichenis TaxID=3064888 RepID=A0ABT9EAJ2_9PROT|nr:AraC family transcriptional regulator [Paracraurococcus sp. LOR1-02]MDO9713003.1 AraC family transcriptional regulator [Paracraurococcus sp. LOR1-02]
MFAELRSHAAGEIPAYVPSFTEIAVQVRGASVVTRKASDMVQRVTALPGTVWLCPAGLPEDFIRIAADIDEVLHMYLLPNPFLALAKHTSQDFTAEAVRYESGFRDPLIAQIAEAVLAELRHETSCGDLLVETLADSLAVRLLSSYSSLRANPAGEARRGRGLDARRLRHVIDYIDANLNADLTVEELAAAAMLSRFHFARMFKATTGQSPSRYIGQRRLEWAKAGLAQGRSITELAYECRFSSESNFVRSFRRVMGVTPGHYRNSI